MQAVVTADAEGGTKRRDDCHRANACSAAFVMWFVVSACIRIVKDSRWCAGTGYTLGSHKPQVNTSRGGNTTD